MRQRRRKLLPDNRLDWRDPDMPVLRLGYKNNLLIMFEVEPAKIQTYYQGKMINHPAPSYRHDESYWWSKK